MAAGSQGLQKDALLGVRVLVVDDEPILASTFCLVLQFAGAYAQSAANGQLALTRLDEESFDIILCDKQMPVMTGLDFVRELNERGDTTPILLFLSTMDYHGIDQVRKLRVHGTLCKPMMPGELVTAIQKALHGSTGMSEIDDF